MARALTDDDPGKMDDPTLAAAWEIANDGRQYDGVKEDRRAIGREMASRLESDGLDIYANGESVIVRGVEREEAETPTGLGFIDVWLHVDFVESPEAETTKVNISEVKCEGGLTALTDHLLERDLAPEWWADNDPLPDSLD